MTCGRYAGSASATAFMALACSMALAATLESRVVDIDMPTTLDAVRIVKVTVAGRELGVGQAGVHEDRAGTPFEADEDWLKTMVIFVHNRTDKTIISGEIIMWFPDTKGANPETPSAITTYRLRFGQRPESARYYRNGSKIPPDTTKPIVLAPGQTLAIPVADYAEAIQSTVEGVGMTPFSHIAKVNLQRGAFYFVDDTRWENTVYSAPDPEHPGHYTALAQDYFPGNLRHAMKLDYQQQ